MATFSTNQARQLYVVNAYSATAPTEASAAGTAFIDKDATSGEVYVRYKGADTLLRSDRIDPKKVIYAKATTADQLQRGLQKFEVTLGNTSTGAPATPTAGQEYILRITFNAFIGLSEEDVYVKDVAVYATPNMTAAQFYIKLKEILELNFKRELVPLLKFTLDNDSTPTKLIIEEVEQPWVLGRVEDTPLQINIQTDSITVDGVEVSNWGTVTPVTPTTFILDGKKIADLEYFCMGERGDTYRYMGYPRVINTKYLVDPDKTYDVIDVHFFEVGANMNSQKSERTMTLVAPTDANITDRLIGELLNAGIEVKSTDADLEDVTFTITPTPSDATVTIDGATQASVEVKRGSTVTWKVAKSGYTTQEGSEVVNYTQTKAITLVSA